MSLQRVGNWSAVHQITNNLKKLIDNACIVAAKRTALKGEGLAKQHIQNQDLGWTALAPATLAQKARKGYSNLIYVATSTYMQSITSWTEDTTALIGVRRGTPTDKGGDLGIVAATLEFGNSLWFSSGGTKGIPPRPLWQPTMRELQEWIKKENNPAKIVLDKLNSIAGTP